MTAIDQHRQLISAGRPRSISPSMAARMVRPVKSTSSTSTTFRVRYFEWHEVVRRSADPCATRGRPGTGLISSSPIDLGAFNVMDAAHESMRQVDAARSDADEGEILNAFIPFQDFVGNAGHGAGNIARVHHDALRRLPGCRFRGR